MEQINKLNVIQPSTSKDSTQSNSFNQEELEIKNSKYVQVTYRNYLIFI
jgi:hypothetical protein